TLVLNEVSNGPAGINAEYFELAVVPVDPCTDQTCLDIRGWMFDDNNGAYSGNGIAPGCGRFSNDPLWSCVALGTLVVVYNSNQPIPSLPRDDGDLKEGNGSFVVGPNNSTYLKFTGAPAPATDCFLPAGPWGPGSWSTCLLANPGDCAIIKDAS